MQASPLWARIPSTLSPLIALALALLLLVSSGCSRLTNAPSSRPLTAPGRSTTASQGRLQEVDPPAAATALAEQLVERSPQVEIVAPADDSLLPEGPWTLQLTVHDWPLADAGSLGIGPHLVVQLDQQQPMRISRPQDAAAIAMPELSPGSHRITVYAARPWGEAVKSPGAMRQIRLHRVGRNAAELPARGTPQLIVASPDGLQQAEPVLIDWLLLDAPLQHLRDDDARWRLRVSVNGDSFLVDRQTPLWLKGFRRGSNAVQLELLDGRGEPLNPPFNSMVREVVIGGGERPSWLRPNLSAEELALLSGEEPVQAPATNQKQSQGTETASTEVAPPLAVAPSPAEPATAATQQDHETANADQAATGPEPGEPARAEPAPEGSEGPAVAPSEEAPEASTPTPSDPETRLALPIGGPNGAATNNDEAVQEPSTPPTTEAREGSEPSSGSAAPLSTNGDQPAEASEPALPPNRISAGTSLSGSARDQVNADGSLLKPKGRGPLAGLREKLGG